MNSPTPSVSFDLATAGGAGSLATPALDLDTMAAIAEEAGRDAVRGRGARAAFDAYSTLYTVPIADDMLAPASRLYRACRRGATDPAPD